MYDAYISEMEQMPQDETYLEKHSRPLGSLPIRVLSTGNHGVHALDQAHPLNAEQQKYEQEVAREQAGWLALSSNAKQLFTDKSSEYIPIRPAELRCRSNSRGVHTRALRAKIRRVKVDQRPVRWSLHLLCSLSPLLGVPRPCPCESRLGRSGTG